MGAGRILWRPPRGLARPHRRFALCVLYSALLLVACSTEGPIIKRTEDFESHFVFGGHDRTYQVHLPATGDPYAETPLIVAFHGSGGTAAGMRAETGLDTIADALGFITVYPDGLYNRWFFGDDAQRYDIDDVGFVDELLNRLEVLLTVDADRMYVTGFSNGGFLTQALACLLNSRLAGAAPVAATFPTEILDYCSPDHPISVLLMLGTDDGSVFFEGDTTRGWLSADESVRTWARASDCDVTATVTYVASDTAAGTRIRREAYPHCAGDVEVELYAVEGGRHRWPTGAFDASSVIAAFLLGHRR